VSESFSPLAFNQSQTFLGFVSAEPLDEACDLGIVVQCDELIEIRPPKRTQDEPLGFYDHVGSLTRRHGRASRVLDTAVSAISSCPSAGCSTRLTPEGSSPNLRRENGRLMGDGGG
jgi:hypothetical protein